MLTQNESLLLNKYLPSGAYYLVMPFFIRRNIQLVLKKERKTLLGSYLYDAANQLHFITINQVLNPQAFLVTLLHEFAHMETFIIYQYKVKSHGQEWKATFKNILIPFIKEKIFFEDVESQLMQSIQNLKAASCSDLALAMVLKNHDPIQNNENVLLKDLKVNDIFLYNNKKFLFQEVRTKRIQCLDIVSKQTYLFYALCEVQKLN